MRSHFLQWLQRGQSRVANPRVIQIKFARISERANLLKALVADRCA